MTWDRATLESLVLPDVPIRYGIVQPGRYVSNGVPVLAIKDLLAPSMETAHRSSVAIEGEYKASRIEPDDVLVSVKGTTGRVGIVPDGFIGNISRDVARLRFRADQVPDFWVQLLRSELGQVRLQQAVVGSTRQELSIGTLRAIEFDFPDAETQASIASTLLDADELIRTTARLIDKKRATKQGIVQAIAHGQSRLSGFSAPWGEEAIGAVATIRKGQQLGRAQMTKLGDVEVWNGGTESSGLTTSANVHQAVVTVSEGGNSCGWVGRPQSGFWLGGHCYALTPIRAGLSLEFLYQLLKAHEPAIMGLRVGSGLPNIQKKALSEYRVLLPTDPAEADEIASVLSDADAEISALEHRLESTRAIKHGMMHELLTGRTRLMEGVAA